VTAGASNVYNTRDVPATAFTETLRFEDRLVVSVREAVYTQLKVVAVDHEVVAQLLSPTSAVAVKSVVPKFMPVKVTVVLPVTGMLGLSPAVSTGLSKEKDAVADPTALPRFTRTSLPALAGATQFMLVKEVQEAVRQRAVPTTMTSDVDDPNPMPAVGVGSETAKLFPLIVRPVPPVAGELKVENMVMIGAV
jgi:hypothetical protein